MTAYRHRERRRARRPAANPTRRRARTKRLHRRARSAPYPDRAMPTVSTRRAACAPRAGSARAQTHTIPSTLERSRCRRRARSCASLERTASTPAPRLLPSIGPTRLEHHAHGPWWRSDRSGCSSRCRARRQRARSIRLPPPRDATPHRERRARQLDRRMHPIPAARGDRKGRLEGRAQSITSVRAWRG